MSCRFISSAGGARLATATATHWHSGGGGVTTGNAQNAAERQQEGGDRAPEVEPPAAERGPAPSAAGASLCAPGTGRAVNARTAAHRTQCHRSQPDHGCRPVHSSAAGARASWTELHSRRLRFRSAVDRVLL